MASKAEASRPEASLPAAPRLGAALRQSGVDFYFQSIRLVLANAAWGLCLLALLAVAGWLGPPVALLLSPILAVPLSGVFRLAALIARGEPPDFSDVTDGWRRYATLALALGASLVLGAAVLMVDLLGAIGSSNLLAWALATLAGWGLMAISVYAFVSWPVLTDPRRDGQPARDRLRLAGLLLAAFPFRFAWMALVLGMLLVASTIAFAALISISVAYTALVACRYVLPAADRLEARLRTRS